MKLFPLKSILNKFLSFGIVISYKDAFVRPLITKAQFDYKKCHCTETTLLHVVNDLLQVSDSVCVSNLSLLGLSAAFNTINHIIQITSIYATFGCSDTVLDWIISL